MNMQSHGYDLALAVQFRRTLLLEPRSAEERDQLAWQPTQQWLAALARASPQALTCFIGKPHNFPHGSTGRCAYLYMVNQQQKIACLGTIFTQQADQDDRTMEINRLEKVNPDQAKILALRPRQTIFRDRIFCKIILTGEEFSENALNEVVSRYLQVFMPALARVPVNWLPRHEGVQLDQEIWQYALATAPDLPPDDFLKRNAEDEIW